MDMGVGVPPFKALDTDPGGTAKRFAEYVEQMKLLFELVFRKQDGTAYAPTDKEKKAMMLLKGGRDMRTMYEHVGKVLDDDSFDEAVKKIQEGLSTRTNKVVQRNMLLTGFPQEVPPPHKLPRLCPTLSDFVRLCPTLSDFVRHCSWSDTTGKSRGNF